MDNRNYADEGPVVSFVNSAYNAIKFIPETVQDGQEKSFLDIEIIIVGDAISGRIADWFEGLNEPRLQLIA